MVGTTVADLLDFTASKKRLERARNYARVGKRPHYQVPLARARL